MHESTHLFDYKKCNGGKKLKISRALCCAFTNIMSAAAEKEYSYNLYSYFPCLIRVGFQSAAVCWFPDSFASAGVRCYASLRLVSR